MQSNIFHLHQHNSQHAELCNAIYERELALLSYANDDAERLRRKLRSLPFYVKKAGWWLIHAQSPLELDPQNASWQAKQRASPPKQSAATPLIKWIDQHVAPGLPLPVLVRSNDFVQVRLDSVDRVDYDKQQLHLNRWGWCSFAGQSLSAEPILFLKPTPALPLRELLLSALLYWPSFTQAMPPLQVD